MKKHLRNLYMFLTIFLFGGTFLFCGNNASAEGHSGERWEVPASFDSIAKTDFELNMWLLAAVQNKEMQFGHGHCSHATCACADTAINCRTQHCVEGCTGHDWVCDGTTDTGWYWFKDETNYKWKKRTKETTYHCVTKIYHYTYQCRVDGTDTWINVDNVPGTEWDGTQNLSGRHTYPTTGIEAEVRSNATAEDCYCRYRYTAEVKSPYPKAIVIKYGDYVNNFSKSSYANNTVEAFTYAGNASIHTADYMGKKLSFREDCYWGDETQKQYQIITDKNNNAAEEFPDGQFTNTTGLGLADYFKTWYADCQKADPNANPQNGDTNGNEGTYWKNGNYGAKVITKVIYLKPRENPNVMTLKLERNLGTLSGKDCSGQYKITKLSAPNALTKQKCSDWSLPTSFDLPGIARSKYEFGGWQVHSGSELLSNNAETDTLLRQKPYELLQPGSHEAGKLSKRHKAEVVLCAIWNHNVPIPVADTLEFH